MGVELLTERHKDQIAGLLSCYDRIIIQGTVPGWCYASGMTGYFYAHEIRIFDYPKWAQPLREGATCKHGASRRRKWNRDRVRAQQEEFPEGGSSQRGSEQTGGASGRS